MADRRASVQRDTLETQINVSINLDGSGQADLKTGLPFLEHMFDQIARLVRTGVVDDVHMRHLVPDAGEDVEHLVAHAETRDDYSDRALGPGTRFRVRHGRAQTT